MESFERKIDATSRTLPTSWVAITADLPRRFDRLDRAQSLCRHFSSLERSISTCQHLGADFPQLRTAFLHFKKQGILSYSSGEC